MNPFQYVAPRTVDSAVAEVADEGRFLAGGIDVRTVAGRLGHADASVTLRVYAHALEARDRELAGLLGSVVLGPVDGRAKLDEADPPAPPELDSAG